MRRIRSAPPPVILSWLTDVRSRHKASWPTSTAAGPRVDIRRRHSKGEDTMRRSTLGILAAVMLVAAGCASSQGGGMQGGAMQQSGTMASASLYDRLGGKPAIQAVVDDFVGNVAG